LIEHDYEEKFLYREEYGFLKIEEKSIGKILMIAMYEHGCVVHVHASIVSMYHMKMHVEIFVMMQ
jgi:hypothetical protein